jgi:glycosyltransferase involved in cell wall biosynthesis
MSRKRMAIVSSYNEACGNASYTHVLKNSFAKHVDCDVIGLDLFVLQKTEKQFVRVGDRHIRDIAEKLKGYDYVNIQFEAGLYGASQADVLRRVRMLMDASKNLTFTMHRIDPPKNTIDTIISQCWDVFWTRGPIGVYKHIIGGVGSRRHELLYSRIIDDVKARVSRGQNVWIAVHTRRERRLLEEFFDCRNVFDYPITFLRPEERDALKKLNDPNGFLRKYNIPDGTKVIGAFGFVSAYKGYETVIRSLTLLPPEFHLCIFGGQHPQSIQPNTPIDPYLGRLIDMIENEDVQIGDGVGVAVARVSPKGKGAKGSKTEEAPLPLRGLLDRVHFIGALDDPEFLEALRLSDAVILPYLEVGQSMSGVVSLALESHANMYCTNNNSMNEVRRYHGNVYTSFDIGNYVELAQKLMAPQRDYSVERDASYAKYNIVENVRRHLEVLGHTPIVDQERQ